MKNLIDYISKMTSEQFSKLTAVKLKPLVKQMQTLSKSKLTQLENYKMYENEAVAPAVRGFIKRTEDKIDLWDNPSVGDFTKLQRQYTFFKQFLTSETSSVKGWENYNKYLAETLNENNIHFDKGDLSKFWEMYDKLTELHKSSQGLQEWIPSKEVQRQLWNYMKESDFSVDIDTVLKKFEPKFEEWYQEQQKKEESTFDMSEFFTPRNDV